MAEPDAHLGVRAAEAGQQRRQVDHTEGLDRPDVQRAAQHTTDPEEVSRLATTAVMHLVRRAGVERVWDELEVGLGKLTN